MDARNFFFSGRYKATSIIVTICSALSLYNAIELILLIFTTFNAYRGLYFWSLLVASCGVIPYTVGLLFEYFQLTSLAVGLAIDNVGWWTMITGQSVVLYSRLGIVLGRGHRKILKAVKWMIIIDAILFHVTTTGDSTFTMLQSIANGSKRSIGDRNTEARPRPSGWPTSTSKRSR